MYKTWRDHFTADIEKVLKQYPSDCPERRKALREVWPRSEPRKYWPYKVYLDEIARQTGKKPPLRSTIKKPTPGQLSLPI